MAHRRRALAFLLPFLASPAAEAGWRYAEWGMTPAALLAASSGQAVATDDGATSVNVEEDGRRVTVHFLFAEGRLETVELAGLWGNACSRLRAELINRYGPDHVVPASLGSIVRRWEDVAGGNVVVLLGSEPDARSDWPCLLQYRNLARQAG